MRRGAIAALALLLLAGCQTTAASPEELVAKREAAGIAACPTLPARDVTAGGLPDLTLDCLGGDSTVHLPSMRGKPMLINVWAQWCPPCRAEAKPLAAFAERAGDKVSIVGIDYNDPDAALALEFAQTVGWKYPQLADPKGTISGPLTVRGIPVTILVGADGRVKYRHTGQLESVEQIADIVERHLGVKV